MALVPILPDVTGSWNLFQDGTDKPEILISQLLNKILSAAILDFGHPVTTCGVGNNAIDILGPET